MKRGNRAWIDVRDPKTARIMALVRASGVPWAKIARESGVSVTTLHNWDRRITKKPFGVTQEFVLNAIGVDIEFKVRAPQTNVVSFPKRRKVA